MGKDDRPTTEIVDDEQILGERPVTGAQPKFQPRPRPPVRDLARTGLFHAQSEPLAVLPSDDAPPTQDETRAPRGPVEVAAQQVVGLCPFPLFQLDPEGRIEWCNGPFCDFARKSLEALAGERVDTTRLGVIYPSVLLEVTTCVQQAQPPTLRQTLRYQLQDGREIVRGCWIVPDTDEAGKTRRLYGYLYPIED